MGVPVNEPARARVSEGFRYFRWRQTFKRPIWVVDRHWYTLVGWLYVTADVGTAGVRARLAARGAWDDWTDEDRAWEIEDWLQHFAREEHLCGKHNRALGRAHRDAKRRLKRR